MENVCAPLFGCASARENLATVVGKVEGEEEEMDEEMEEESKK